jgi:phosphatidylserine decarboxylase
VQDVIYKRGKFLDARDNDALDNNESNTIVFRSDNEKLRRFAIRQIVGAIARRIVCVVKPGDVVCAGSRIGMMKFGSRTDLLVPTLSGAKWKVNIGDKVKAGVTVLAEV